MPTPPCNPTDFGRIQPEYRFPPLYGLPLCPACRCKEPHLALKRTHTPATLYDRLKRERRSPALCFWLGDTHHCPKVYAQKCPKDRKILRIYRQRQGLCTKTHHHTRPVGHKGWLRGITFVWIYVFLGKSCICLKTITIILGSTKRRMQRQHLAKQ